MKQNKSELSELRKEIHELLAELQRLLSVLSSRKPMLRGTVYVLRRRCGKERCRCCDGELHQTEVFSCTEGGVRVLRPVRGAEKERLRKLTGQYRRFRTARIRLRKIFQRLLAIVNAFEEARLAEGRKCKRHGE